MIEEVFYNENRTYIKDTKDSEITTDNLTLAGAFDLACYIILKPMVQTIILQK